MGDTARAEARGSVSRVAIRGNHNGRSRRFTVTRIRSAATGYHRRRGSVLVLVMTLLGVLFVTGMAFLASVNFEAKMIDVEKQRSLDDIGVGAVLDETSAVLRESVLGGVDAPFGGRLDDPLQAPDRPRLGEAPAVLGELPGVHDWFAPIEPYYDADSNRYLFRWFTDLKALSQASSDEPFADTLARRGEVNVAWTSGVPINPSPDVPIPVDSDGDGVTDTLQFEVITSGEPGNAQVKLGLSSNLLSELARLLNAPTNPSGSVFLGMRVIAHGGLVNLNESHPTLIANALDLQLEDVSRCGPDPNYPYFIHRPTCDPGVTYSPQLEEPMLRRRGLLPPRVIAPSLLHGNRLLDPETDGQEFGFADMPTKLYSSFAPNQFGTVFDGQHRYSPFDGLNEMYNANYPLWGVRMEPDTSYAADATGDAYDRRHLITTISHDDLLSRGGRAKVFDLVDGVLIGDADMRQMMIAINQGVHDPDSDSCPTVLPFEYADYPHDIRNSGCDCPTDPDCSFNPRKGRLVLSLPWLDDAFSDDGDPDNDIIQKDLRQRLIHDVFMLLVRNARGPYWDDIVCACPPGVLCAAQACPEGEACYADTDRLCHDDVTGQTHRHSTLSRTAASLTANVIDFMDFDEVDGDGIDHGLPTRVALRSFDFSNPATVGRTLAHPTETGESHQYVYGLEQQPYITEVTTAAEGGLLTAWAVELFNPYGEDVFFDSGEDEYYLIPVDPSGGFTPTAFPTSEWVRLDRRPLLVEAGGFTALVNDPNGLFGDIRAAEPNLVQKTGLDKLQFWDGYTIYLVRRVQLSGETDFTNIVVDQFKVDGQGIGKEGDRLVEALEDPGSPDPHIFSMARGVGADSRWTAPVPIAVELGEGDHSLAFWNSAAAGDIRPVEVNFANTGSFTEAFPTTGSLLLLMRHANRALSDFAVVGRGLGGVVMVQKEDLAFTTWLDDETGFRVSDPTAPEVVFSGILEESKQVDNGRMPVFDTVVFDTLNPSVGRLYAHHIDPGFDRDFDPPEPTTNRPGGLAHLPWGQLIWDYFTALPLSSPGPYENADFDPSFVPGKPASQPRVDQDGLRVHGRININAAPWKVLAGVPLIPMERIPQTFRAKTRLGIGLDSSTPDDAAARLGNELAKGIVAYRENRAIDGSGDYGTGEYASDMGPGELYGRAWEIDSPAARRGTGFLSVGELANVRHLGASVLEPGANESFFRIDYGELSDSRPDYVKAVGLLVSLSDWVTIRSHVFTIYGTLRGGVDETIEDTELRAADVDKRALRFQETVDRLPTFLGKSAPARIGERVAGPYIDTRND